MSSYNDEYLYTYFDEHEFFDPECRDRRVREVNMRTKRCLSCPGLEGCRKYPEFWLQGQEDRELANQAAAALED